MTTPSFRLQEIPNFNKPRSHRSTEIYLGREFYLDTFEREIKWIKYKAFDPVLSANFCFSNRNRKALPVVFPNTCTNSLDRDREIL